MLFDLMHGDCLTEMDKIPDKSVDAIIADLPYGLTDNTWDSIVPFEPLWLHFERVLKDGGAVALFGIEPFSTVQRMSNFSWYKYDWIWKKSQSTGFLNAWKQPMRNTELISIFYDGQCIYNPQIFPKPVKNIRPVGTRENFSSCYRTSYIPGARKLPNTMSMPSTIIEFPNEQRWEHPTQKPLPLLEYLVKTYTNEGDTVLDCTMGSGTTGAACGRLNRRFIGIELDPDYFAIAENRIKNAYGDFVRTPEEVKRGQLALFEGVT